MKNNGSKNSAEKLAGISSGANEEVNKEKSTIDKADKPLKRYRISRLLKPIGIGLFVVLLILLVLIIWLAGTQSGLHFLIARTQSALPELQLGLAEGRLIGPLRLESINYKTSAMSVTAQRVELNWRALKLLGGHLSIEHLLAADIEYRQLAASVPTTAELETNPNKPLTVESLQLPIDLSIDKVDIQRVTYFPYTDSTSKENAEPITLKQFLLAGEYRNHYWKITRLKIDSSVLELTGDMAMDLANNGLSQGQLQWQLPLAEMATLKGHTVLSGDFTKALVQQDLAAPYHIQTNITVTDLLEDYRLHARLTAHSTLLSAIQSTWPAYQAEGELVVEGNAETATIKSELSINDLSQPVVVFPKPVTIALNSEWKNQQLNLQALTVQPLPESEIRLQGQVDLAPQLRQKGAAELALNLDWQRLQWPLTVEPALADISSSQGQLSVAGTIEQLLIKLQAELGEQGRVSGEIQARNDQQQPHIDMDLQWQQLTFPQAQPRLRLTEGRLQALGSPSDYQFNVSSDLISQLPATLQTPASEQAGKLHLVGSGSKDSLNIPTLKLEAFGGTLSGQLNTQFGSERLLDVKIEGNQLNPGVLHPQWPGALAISVVANNALDSEGQWQVKVPELTIEGQLRDKPVSISANGLYRDQFVEVTALLAKSGESTLSASAKLTELAQTPKINAQWSLASQSLGDVLPQARGSIHSQGQWQGSLMQPKVNATAALEKVRWQKNRVDSLEANIEVDWREPVATTKPVDTDQASVIRLLANNIQLENTFIERLQINGTGRPESHRISLEVDIDQGQVNTAIDGQFLQQQWQFHAKEARLSYGELPPWSLAEPLQGRITADEQTLQAHCWQSREASLCLEGENTSQGAKGNMRLSQFDLNYFQPLMPETVKLEGVQLNGQGNITIAGDTPVIDLRIDSSAGQWLRRLSSTDKKNSDHKASDKNTAAVPARTEALLELAPGLITIATQQEKIHAQLQLPFKGQPGLALSVDLQAKTPNAAFSDYQINGDLRLGINNIGIVEDFIADAENVQGDIQGQWQVRGTVQKPSIKGQLALRDAEMDLISPGLSLKNIQLAVNSGTAAQQAPANLLRYQLSAESGGGTLEAKGSLDLQKDEPELALKLWGEKFQVAATNEAEVFVSPDISIRTQGKNVNIRGKVTVPMATIAPQQIPPSAVTVSSDQVIAQEQAEKAPPPVVVDADIALSLGEQVAINAFGFKGRAVGDLQLRTLPGSPTMGTGEIDILDGEYRAYGQGLVVEKGKILFTGGAVTKPAIDVKALRRPAEDITVGIFARGNISEPKVTLFSEPGMSQAAQLSWLVLGQAPGKSGEGNALNQLALSLGLSQAGSSLNKLSESLYVDSISIKTGSGEAGAASDNNSAELVIGKYLSPNLYVSYGLGLFEPISVLQLEYSLSKYWKLTTESSTRASGGDIIYTIEK